MHVCFSAVLYFMTLFQWLRQELDEIVVLLMQFLPLCGFLFGFLVVVGFFFPMGWIFLCLVFSYPSCSMDVCTFMTQNFISQTDSTVTADAIASVKITPAVV